MTPALEQIKALPAKWRCLKGEPWQTKDGRDALDYCIAALERRLQALRDEAGKARSEANRLWQELREVAVALGGIGCPTQQMDVARNALTARLRAAADDVHALYTRPTPAAEAAPQGGVFLELPACVRRDIPYRPLDESVCAALEVVNEAANNARHNGEYLRANALVEARVTLYRAAATPPSAPAVDEEKEAMRRALERIKFRLHFMGWPAESFWNNGTADAPHWIADWRYEIALLEHALHGSPITVEEKPTDTKPRHEIDRLSAPVPQEGVDAGVVRRAVRAYDEWMAANQPDKDDAYHDGMRAALEAALAAGALPQGMVLVPRERIEAACDLLSERKHGNPARSPAHNARLLLEAMLAAAPAQGVR